MDIKNFENYINVDDWLCENNDLSISDINKTLVNKKIIFINNSENIPNYDDKFSFEKIDEDLFLSGLNTDNIKVNYPPECCYFKKERIN